MIQARCLREQRRFFDDQLAPLFERRLVRWITSRKASLFGLGIPPAQYDELIAGDDTRSMAQVLCARLEKLACHFPLRDNYFAWQAFSRRYSEDKGVTLPAYLDPAHHETIRTGTDNVHIHHRSLTELLRRKPADSVDRYVLLDAQDWMRPEQLDSLWTEINRTAAPDARVIFRTAGRPSILEGRLSNTLLDHWDYRRDESKSFCQRDRSAIYGGFHLYVKRDT